MAHDDDRPEDGPHARRAALMRLAGFAAGGLAVTALAGCTTEDPAPDLGATAQALAGTLLYADTMADLRAMSGTVSSIAVLKGYWTIGDGGGGLFYWSTTAAPDNWGTIINLGYGNTAGWRRIYEHHLNARWFGVVSIFDGLGFAQPPAPLYSNANVLNKCASVAATTGLPIFVPSGSFIIDGTLSANSPVGAIRIERTSPTTPHGCALYGTGIASQLIGINIGAGQSGIRGVVELFGTGGASPLASFKIANLQIICPASYGTGGSPYLNGQTNPTNAFGVIAGDATNLVGEHLIVDGQNALALRSGAPGGSGSAQIDTVFRSSQFYAAATDRFSLDRDTASSPLWQNVRFESCIFRNLARTAGTIVDFDNCQFLTSAAGTSSVCASVQAGSASFRSCYFENHTVGVRVEPGVAAATIANCYFYPTWSASRAIDVNTNSTTAAVGLVHVSDTIFVDDYNPPLYVDSVIRNGLAPGGGPRPASSLKVEGAVVTNLGGLAASPVRISPNPHTSLYRRDLAHEGTEPMARVTEKVRWKGTTSAATSVAGVIEEMATQATFVVARACWISKVTLYLDAVVASSSVAVTVTRNPGNLALLSGSYQSTFTRATTASAETGYRTNPTTTALAVNDLLTVALVGTNFLTAGRAFVIEVELAF